MTWTRNRGQYAADVAGVIDVEHVAGEYTGASVVKLSRDLSAFTAARDFDITAAGVLDAETETREPHGMASGHKIIIFHGTIAAAILAVKGQKS